MTPQRVKLLQSPRQHQQSHNHQHNAIRKRHTTPSAKEKKKSESSKTFMATLDTIALEQQFTNEIQFAKDSKFIRGRIPLDFGFAYKGKGKERVDTFRISEMSSGSEETFDEGHEGQGGGMGSGNRGDNAGDNGGGSEDARENIVLEGPLEALRSSLLSGRFSDLTVFHGSREWKAHKVVVCSQSPVLASMAGNEASSSSCNAPQTLRLDEFDHDAVTALMQYLYTSAYTIPPHSTYESAPAYSLPLHESIFYLSVALQIPALEILAAASFRHTLNTQISSLPIYFACIPRIYSKTSVANPGLREALVEAAVQEMKGILKEENVRTTLWQVCAQNKEFWADVMNLLVGSRDCEVREVEVQQVLCEECGARDEGDEYVLELECKDCGETRRLSFL